MSIVTFIDRIITKMLQILGILKNRWCLAIVNKNFSIEKIIKPPKNFFWADPFFFKYKNKEYVFYESYSYKRKKGEIACGQLKNNNIIKNKIFLKKNYHLSYPFIYKINNKIFLIPETHQKKELQVYISVKFPFKWKLYSTAFKDISMVDTTIIKIKKNIWLFTNQVEKNINDFNKKLYIYKINNLKLKKIISHSKNPVINSLSGGRNAGNIFKIGNKIIRPSQINKNNKYGYGLKLSIIKKINLKDYKEKKINVLLPEKNNISGIHHVSKVNKNQYIVDVCLKYSKNC